MSELNQLELRNKIYRTALERIAATKLIPPSPFAIVAQDALDAAKKVKK